MTKKNTYFFYILFLLLYLSFELLSYLGLIIIKKYKFIEYSPIIQLSLSEKHEDIIGRLVNDEAQPGAFKYDPVLGWSLNPNTSISEETETGKIEIIINSQGVRSSKEFTQTPTNIRIATFGDSFVFGAGVSNNDTFQNIISTTDERFEVLNSGIGGGATDQAFLRYKHEGARFNPHIVIIGYFHDNINRNVNRFRPFLSKDTGIPLTKPRFILEDDKLVLLQNPMKKLKDYQKLLIDPESELKKLGVNDYWYKRGYTPNKLDFLPSVKLFSLILNRIKPHLYGWPDEYDISSEPFSVTVKIIEGFYKDILNNNSLPIILLFPSEGKLSSFRRTKKKSYSELINVFQERGYRYLDTIDAFDRYAQNTPTDRLFNGHFSPLGNELTARYIIEYINNNNLDNIEHIRKEIMREKRLTANGFLHNSPKSWAQ